MYNIKLMRICLKVAKRLHETVQLDTNVDLTTNFKIIDVSFKSKINLITDNSKPNTSTSQGDVHAINFCIVLVSPTV